MKYILITICSIILSPFLANQIVQGITGVPSKGVIPKICVDCKFYTKNLFGFSEFGKCALFPKENNSFLVNGHKNKEYYYCYTSREFEDMCGKDGKCYQPKIKRTFFLRTPKRRFCCA